MRLPEVQQFICGYSIKTGALVISWFSFLFGALILAPLSIGGKQIMQTTVDLVMSNMNRSGEVNATTIEEVDEIVSTGYYTLLAIMVVVTAISALQVLGVHLKNRYCMVPYLAVTVFGIVLSVIWIVLLALGTVATMFMAQPLIFIDLVIQLAAALTSTVIQAYCFLVLKAYYSMCATSPPDGFVNFSK